MVTKIEQGNKKWIHITDFSEKDLDILAGYKFRSLDVESVAMPLQRSKVEIYRYYAYLVLNLPFLNSEKIIKNRRVDIFINNQVLVTITKKPVKYLDDFFSRVSEASNQEKYFKHLPNLLHNILRLGTREVKDVAAEINNSLNAINKEVLQHGPRRTLEKISLERRNIVVMLTLLKPILGIFSQIGKSDGFFSDKDRELYDSVFDELKVIWDSVEDFREFVIGLASTSESLVSYQINNTIRLLTIFSVFLLPLTFLASLYGMNIDLPLQDRPGLVFSLFGGIAVLEIVIYQRFRKRR